MKEKFYVPFGTAQRLKANGYNEECERFYNNFGMLTPKPIVNNNKHLDHIYHDMKMYSAPTYHEVIDWLESRGIRVFAHYYLDNGKWVYVIEDFKRLQDNAGFFNTREEALNAAILKALELI